MQQLDFPSSEIQLLVWHAVDSETQIEQHMRTIRTYQNVVVPNGVTIWNLLKEEEDCINKNQKRSIKMNTTKLLAIPTTDFECMTMV